MLNKRDVARFWSKVNIPQYDHLCWEWKAGLFENGYGQFKVDGQSTQAHRFAFAYFNGGGLEEWEHICHKCDNRKCCNPSHLFGGSAQDNVRDAEQKDRRESQRHARSGERNNFAKLTEDLVRDIRTEYAKGNVTYEILANRYNVSLANVGMVIRRDTWKHVPGPRSFRITSGSAVDLADYRKWQDTQACEDCGAKQSDRPKDADGNRIGMWADETLCMECSQKRSVDLPKHLREKL